MIQGPGFESRWRCMFFTLVVLFVGTAFDLLTENIGDQFEKPTLRDAFRYIRDMGQVVHNYKKGCKRVRVHDSRRVREKG